MSMPRLTRRQLFKTGVFGAMVLGSAVYLAGPPADELPDSKTAYQFLSGLDAVVITTIAPVLLGVHPGRNGPSMAALLDAFDELAASLPVAAQDELHELFGLLENRWLRRWLAGVPQQWAHATPDMVRRFLVRWQTSSFVMCRSGYQSLHSLCATAWYGHPASWLSVGYQLPVEIVEQLP